MKQWAVNENDKIRSWVPIDGSTENELKPGLYQLSLVGGGMFAPSTAVLREMKVEADILRSLPGSLAEYIVNIIESFWNNKEKYKAMGMLHKRGVLMEGAPGTGKTAICLLAGTEVSKRGGAALFTGPSDPIRQLPSMLKTVREWHPELPILNIMEDIDKHRSCIDYILPMLDGENQVGNILHLATTNFIDKLDARLKNRPSRFDEVIKVKPPAVRARITYLKQIMPEGTSHDVIKQIADASKGFNFSHVKELAVAYHVYGKPLAKTADRLRAMSENRSTGFADGEEEEE